MIKWSAIFAFLFYVPAMARDTFSQTQIMNDDDALRVASRAITSMPKIKKRVKYFENKLWYYLPLDKNNAAVIGGVAATLVQGRFSTKSIKNLNMDFFGGKVRADFQYDFKQDATESFINCNWDL